MTKYYNFGLNPSVEQEIKNAFSSLNKKTAVYKPLLSELIKTAYKVQSNKILTEADLKIFEKGLFESHAIVFYEYSGKFLCQLSYINKTVQDLFIQLSTHKSSKVRLNNMTNLLCKPSKPVLDHVIENGLNDKSSTVRIKTADVISRLDLKEYAKILPTYIQKEEKAKVKESLEFCLYWLTHDYKIEEKTEYGYSIWVKTESGGTGVIINDRQFKNLDKTIEKIKNGIFKYD